MPLRNSCFISFRHGQQALSQRFVSDLYEALHAELEAQLGRGVGIFIDKERLQGGDLFNDAIAEHLCESTCLVVVYTPPYFDREHTYCAREYRAMIQLEETRLKLLPEGHDRTHGLIIPVIFRGGKYLPKEIRDNRQCYDFADFLLTGRHLSSHPKYAAAIREMAEYISERHRLLAAVTNHECKKFRLPTNEEISPWLEGVLPTPMMLPGRTNDE